MPTTETSSLLWGSSRPLTRASEIVELRLEECRLDWHLGNAVKYLLRAGKKPENPLVQDLEKALWYIRRRIQKEGEK